MSKTTELIVALDMPNQGAADALVEQIGSAASWYKIGLELYCAEGPAFVRGYVQKGHQVFLDLKLHDIPATVMRSTKALAALGIGLLTVHSSGGLAMMRAAVEASAASHGEPMGILAVTALTSLDDRDLQGIGVSLSVKELVLKRAHLAVEAGCRGVVASPHEAKMLREVLPKDFLIVTPGIRPAGTSKGDQKRVMTPKQAKDAGADMIVVGRPVRDAENPRLAIQEIMKELQT